MKDKCLPLPCVCPLFHTLLREYNASCGLLQSCESEDPAEPHGCNMERFHFEKKIPHWKMVMLNVMNFQILLPLIPLEDIGMGVTINACFKFVHFFLSIKFILSILPSIFRPTKRKRRYLMYLNYFSRNNSRVIYNENTGFSPKWQI